MELWIRSQDKTKLIKAENIMIIEDVIKGMTIVDVSKGETIQPPIKSEIMIIASDMVVGTYKTKERAIEVLNEIQKILQPIVIYKEPKIDYNGDFIQQMSQNMLVQSTQKVEMKLKQAGQIVYEMPEE